MDWWTTARYYKTRFQPLATKNKFSFSLGLTLPNLSKEQRERYPKGHTTYYVVKAKTWANKPQKNSWQVRDLMKKRQIYLFYLLLKSIRKAESWLTDVSGLNNSIRNLS